MKRETKDISRIFCNKFRRFKFHVLCLLIFMNIINLAKENDNFRKVVEAGNHSQVVLMSLLPNEDIGEEVHDENDQILVFVEGEGKAVIDGEESSIGEGDLFLVKSGTRHNFINTSSDSPLKLYTVYSPAHHPADRVQKTKEQAMAEEY